MLLLRVRQTEKKRGGGREPEATNLYQLSPAWEDKKKKRRRRKKLLMQSDD